jgi:hypothetical protein
MGIRAPRFPPTSDHTLSLHLDALIVEGDARPLAPRRAWLCLRKRLAERTVPPYLGPQVKP